MRQALLPGDPEVREISLYRKFNRCQDGSLRAGHPAPDAPLVWVAVEQAGRGEETAEKRVRGVRATSVRTSVHSLLREAMGRPLVLVAGSYS